MIGDSEHWRTLADALDEAPLSWDLRTRVDNLVAGLVRDERHDVLASLALATVSDGAIDDFVGLPDLCEAPMAS